MTGESNRQGRDSEQYYYASSDPHTAVPDWVPFASTLSCEARNLIMATLVLQKRGTPPTRRQLATALSVDERSIYRWLLEIKAAGALATRRAGRRRLCVFHKPKPDHMISDHMISDRAITDRPIRISESESLAHVSLERHETPIPDQAISDRAVGGGGDHHVLEDSPTNTNRGPLKTALARWLKRAGMNAARDFDDLALDYRLYREFVEAKRYDGWSWNQIVTTLREAPLHAPIGDLDYSADVRVEHLTPAEDDEANDQADQIDSTSRQLARRFEADRLEAQARAAGLVNAAGKAL